MAHSTAVRTTNRPGAYWTILLCFFASGISGLVYQVVWVRELVLVFGATTFAVSTVLTAFMGGLALGSFYFGRRSERVNRPLRLYGLIEIGIGVYGLAVPFIFALLPSLYQPFWNWLHLSFFAISIVRFIFAALVLIVPTALMGATLPVLSSYYARDHGRIGLHVGSLYALNTFGAVMGAAATGFVLIPSFGMRATTATAAAINILLGLVALSFARKYEADTDVLDPRAERASVDEVTPGKRIIARLRERRYRLLGSLFPFFTFRNGVAAPETKERKSGGRIVSRPSKEALSRKELMMVLVAFGVSGFIALSYEVIWSRVLALIIGSSVYAFSIMLTTFLIGLAAGASLASRFVDRIKRPVLVFALIEIGVGITSLAGAYMFNDLPYVFIQLYRWLEATAFGVLLFARFLVAMLVMIVPTLMLGALFPLVVRIVSRSRERATGRMVGDVYAANTLGAITGSFASGFVLVPWLGLLGSLRLAATLNFLVAASMFLVSHLGEKRRGAAERRRHGDRTINSGRSKGSSNRAASPRLRVPASSHFRLSASVGLVVSAVLVVGAILIEPKWDSDVMSSAVYRYAPSLSEKSKSEIYDYFTRGQGETIFYKEGVTATIAVQRAGENRVLKSNGKPEASTTGDMPTQILIGGLPLLVRPQTDDVLLIGLGSGITLGSVEQFPIKSVTCVELEPAIIEASEYFNDFNNRPLDDPRLRMIANDGRNFIYTTDEKFDVIISEPSNPWLTGVANLFTLEFFKRGAERLKDDGIFSQWLQIYEMAPEDVKTLIATFKAAFPYVYVFRGAEGDIMLLGSKREQRIDLSTIKSHFDDPRVAAELDRIKTYWATDILSRFYLGPKEVETYVAGAHLNTDDNALIEFNAPRRVGTTEETVQRNLNELLARAAPPLDYLAGEIASADGKADLLINTALGAVKRNDHLRAEQFVNYALEIADTAQAHGMKGELLSARGDEAGAIASWKQALQIDPNHFYTVVNLGKLYLTKQDLARATPYLERAIQIDPSSARAHHLRGLAYQAVGDNQRAVIEYRKALPDVEYTRWIKTYYLNFGTALVPLGLYEEAAQMFEEYARLAPGDFEAHYQLGAVYEVLAERTLDDNLTYRAVDELTRALKLKPDHPMSHYYLSKAYRRLGLLDQAEAEFNRYDQLAP
jgi:spermidine synthase